MDYKEFFKGKKITLMGLGLLGRGVGDALFLSSCGAEILVTDTKSEVELADSVEKLKGVSNIKFKLGGHDLEDFKHCDMVLKAAGVPLDSIYIAEARKNNIPVYMGAALFTKLAEGVVTIGITGTRGKSTTTHLIHHILKTAGKSVHLGGNVRDIATLPLLQEVKSGDYAVLELDSWQLQGFGDAGVSPHIAVFTTFMDDHMNYYKGDREQYFKDKSSIYRSQKENDTLVAGEDVSSVIASKDQYKGNLVIARREYVSKEWDVKIPGDHNLLNISCAIKACEALGISQEDIKKGVESFVGVEGRLQFLKAVDGVKIYNDNNATTPDATVAGIKALAGMPTVLIAGGADKDLPLDSLVAEINQNVQFLVLLPGTGSERLKTAGVTIEMLVVKDLEEAISVAKSQAKAGDTILFSPGFASFGLFKNEYDRNDQFLKLTENI
jgi:UDP-N-acetylmuramoylalanine--D-glutamate ligase